MLGALAFSSGTASLAVNARALPVTYVRSGTELSIKSPTQATDSLAAVARTSLPYIPLHPVEEIRGKYSRIIIYLIYHSWRGSAKICTAKPDGNGMGVFLFLFLFANPEVLQLASPEEQPPGGWDWERDRRITYHP